MIGLICVIRSNLAGLPNIRWAGRAGADFAIVTQFPLT